MHIQHRPVGLPSGSVASAKCVSRNSPHLQTDYRGVLRAKDLAYHSDFRMDTKDWEYAFTGANCSRIIAEHPSTRWSFISQRACLGLIRMTPKTTRP